jgi:hypothetical protein
MGVINMNELDTIKAAMYLINHYLKDDICNSIEQLADEVLQSLRKMEQELNTK